MITRQTEVRKRKSEVKLIYGDVAPLLRRIKFEFYRLRGPRLENSKLLTKSLQRGVPPSNNHPLKGFSPPYESILLAFWLHSLALSNLQSL